MSSMIANVILAFLCIALVTVVLDEESMLSNTREAAALRGCAQHDPVTGEFKWLNKK